MIPKIVFFGSPDFAATILEHLISKPERYSLVGVVTTPDRPVGRKQELTESSVAQTAQRYHLPLFKPETLDSANLAHIKLLKADLFLVAAYGKIIPKEWLAAPTKSTLNLHYSLLPKYRGALCVSQAIKNCDPVTGVSLMEMDEELDHGPIIAQSQVEIASNDSVATLTEKLTSVGIQLLDQTLPAYLDGEITPTTQDEQSASYTPSYKTQTRQTAFVPWKDVAAALAGQNAKKLDCLIRSLNPEPGAWTTVPTKAGQVELKLLSTQLDQDRLVLTKVQKPGKTPTSWSQFTSGHQL
jgi:methionyl-tRNA formyltransferase